MDTTYLRVSDIIIDGLLDGLEADQILTIVRSHFSDAKSTHQTVRHWRKMINYIKTDRKSRGRLIYESYIQNMSNEEIHKLANSKFSEHKVNVRFIMTFVSQIKRIIERMEIRDA